MANAFLRGITSGTFTNAPLASSCRALRSATTPSYGRRMRMGKFVTASLLALLVQTSMVLTILLGAHGQGFAQTTPAAESPATPAPAAQQPTTPVPAAQKPDS